MNSGDATNDYCDLEELAALFGVTEKAVRGWIANGMPVAIAGKRGRGVQKTQISLRDAVEWYFDSNFERLELDRQRTRLAEEQADKLALENAERRGELAEVGVWQSELGKFLAETRSALLSLPVKVAPLLDGDVNQRKDRLEKAVHELLTALANYQPAKAASQRTNGDIGDRNDSSASAETDSERVGRRESTAQQRKQRRARTLEN